MKKQETYLAFQNGNNKSAVPYGIKKKHTMYKYMIQGAIFFFFFEARDSGHNRRLRERHLT